jgi:bifunctional ADP-heptose synthase (sugar kinase/adenylyltransferase)
VAGLTTDFLEQVLSIVPHKTVGLIGDLFLDRYFDIDPALDEPSVETGLTAYQITRVRCYAGALGTVANNLSALGVGRIIPVSIIGDDGEGYELRQALGLLPSVDSSCLVACPERRTPTYTKPMRAGVELNRLDIKNRTPTPTRLIEDVLRRAESIRSSVDAWLILDQVSERDCGVVTAKVRDWCRTLEAFKLADSRERIREFEGLCIKPNQSESADLDHSRFIASFVTLGERGIRLIHNGLSSEHPAFPVLGPTDICGAGDSCSAGIACAIVAGGSFEQAAAFGNLVASITVQQIGVTGTATPAQIRSRWDEFSRWT